MKNKDKINASKLLYGLLVVSVGYFLVKGFQYLFIGSYVPLIFIVVIGMLLVWSFTKSEKAHRRALRFWAILLLLWSIIRLGLWLILEIDTNLTESHLREQFGLLPNIISILLLFIGIKILRDVRLKKE